MKYWITAICLFIITQLSAGGSLRNLIEYDKTTCIKQLEYATKEELWDAFLDGQAQLFYNSEFQWLRHKDWWQQSKSILEIGSGNGVYLAKLADHFPEKMFCGLEKLPFLVAQSNEHLGHKRLMFEAWDAEELNLKLINSANIVLFRLTLQHLEKPLIALNNAWQYLLPNGHVVVIDSFDLAKKSSHPIKEIEDALQAVAELQKSNGKGNRKITLDILVMLENQQPPLNDSYELVFSNLDKTGSIAYEIIRIEGEQNRRLYFNHGLLFLTLLSHTYQIPVNLNKAYDELKSYVEDEDAWIIPGMHFLVLKRKS